MRLTVIRLYEDCKSKNVEDSDKSMIQQTAFDISLKGITNKEEIDEAIHQLQKFKYDIVDGCHKPELSSDGCIRLKTIKPQDSLN